MILGKSYDDTKHSVQVTCRDEVRQLADPAYLDEGC